MKRTKLMKALCAMLAAALCLAAMPAFAVTQYDFWDGYFTETDMEKLATFWSQEAYDGMINGEAVYDVENISSPLLDPPHITYGGSFYTSLLDLNCGHWPGFGFRFAWEFPFSYEIDGECVDGYVAVTPDLYGELDLAGTSVIVLGNPSGTGMTRLALPAPGQTHISGVLLDDCYQLERIFFNGQEHCTCVSATNCPELRHVSLLNNACKNIDLDIGGEEKLSLYAFGHGAVGVEYEMGEGTVYAYPEEDDFFGWYENGELVSTELEYEYAGGGSLVACFGGDADGDGAVTAADALIALRTSMDVAQDVNTMLDINGSGAVDTADALLILRFAMGLI